jgi:ribosomal protein L40E
MQQPSYKICPRCQQAAVLNAPTCLRCGRTFQTIQLSEVTQVVTPTISAPSVCWSCMNRVDPHAIFCWHCGSNLHSGVDAPFYAQQGQSGLVWAMWFLTIADIALILLTQGAAYVAVVGFDGIAVGLAIALICGKNETDKKHGWGKIVLEIIAAIITILSLTNRPSY